MASSAQTTKRSTDDSVQIVLIGKTGSGKSSSGNTILNKKHFLSAASGKSVTLKCKTATEIINGKKVTVVDTPGWDCTEHLQQDFRREIEGALKNLNGLYSFLLVIQVGPVEAEEISKIYGLSNVFGPSYLDHTTILFSHSDNLEQKSFQEFLREGGNEFQALLESCGHRCHYWNNREGRSDKDVEKLLIHLKKTESEHLHSVKSSQNNTTKKNAVRVLFLGMTNVGKTTSIGTLQGRGEQTENKDVYKYGAAGLSLQLIDSPGFDQNPEQIQEVISTSLSTSEPHVIMIVMSVDSFSPETKSIMQHVQDCLGENATKHTMILFTGKDNLEEKPIDRFIEENKDLRKLVSRNGNRFHALNNRDTRDQRQVDELLQKITHIHTANSGEFYKTEEKCPGPVHEKGTVSTQNVDLGLVNKTLAIDSQNCQNTVRVLFLGMIKVGKTSSIRTLQRRGEQTENKDVYYYSAADLCLQLIDSPGFDENPQEIQKVISKSMSTFGPHVIMIVMNTDRFSPATKSIMQHVQDCLGENATKHAMILFTGKDNLEGKPIDRFIEENEDLRKLVSRNGNRFHALNNRDTSDRGQVDELLQKIADIHTANRGEFYKTEDKCPGPAHEKGTWFSGFSWKK